VWINIRHVQTGGTDYKNVFLQLVRIPSKHELQLLYVVALLWPFVQTFLKHSSPEMRNFLTFSSRLIYSCIKNTCYSTVCLSWGTLLHQWMYQ